MEKLVGNMIIFDGIIALDIATRSDLETEETRSRKGGGGVKVLDNLCAFSFHLNRELGSLDCQPEI